MITKKELQEYAKTTRLNLGQAEKDYFQSIALFVLYQEYGKELIFKGGTALKKCYGLDRFSEDLDFTSTEKTDTKILDRGLKRFGIEYEKEAEKYPNGIKTIYRLHGPLYTGIRQTLCKFIVDLSFRENVILPPQVKTIGRFLNEIPSFDVYVMQEKEILAEKIRAILTRNKARDIYDLQFLLTKGIGFDKKLAKEKMKYYGKGWDPKNFRKKLNITEKAWKTELQPLVPSLPDLKETEKNILAKIRPNKQHISDLH
ncbi:MAG: nucleotidyl transferase AbiEii/AbiGii toxin family protein [Candidatus Altiarchaeota archaeon]|nr:nucleotidyl transferase AbiEii/AbiGii toxin family protein [Candidatus Altiarchaeota archaeon]